VRSMKINDCRQQQFIFTDVYHYGSFVMNLMLCFVVSAVIKGVVRRS
jgi:hypothetical protein